MPISRSERDVLFGTAVPSRQMEKYLAQKKTCTFEQFRNEFHDLSRGLFWSSFIRLTHGGKAVKEDEIIRYTGDPDLMRGRNIELAWKTIFPWFYRRLYFFRHYFPCSSLSSGVR